MTYNEFCHSIWNICEQNVTRLWNHQMMLRIFMGRENRSSVNILRIKIEYTRDLPLAGSCQHSG
ncbi:hypothetical protein N7462_000638 [Penicillium macrosclerotiorum]|uniref:uncharacterized protein n=1 Tax=Penicillium macrosclerotiorum TaxID=303699 RepID=UPI002547B79D|nr:uncharacterized protein N7462_000638 [Penicillium macrosclerotiorum]KAJ5698633.1 hypothetical protein N7462_000638 [Penicillium macrosclerotiorum]